METCTNGAFLHVWNVVCALPVLIVEGQLAPALQALSGP